MSPCRSVLPLLAAVLAFWVPVTARALALDPFLSPSPALAEGPGVLATTNDSFGPGPVDEWDDLDSFGMRAVVPIGQATILGAISGLTDRGDSGTGEGRIDEASVGAAWTVVSRGSFQASVAAGLDAEGNFGGLFIQQGFHNDTGVGRPVPTTYTGGFALAPLGAFKLLFTTPALVSPYFVVAGRGSVPLRGSLLAVAGIRYARPGALLALGGGWRAAGSAASSSTVMAVDAAENGPYLGFEMRTGLLSLSFEDSPLRRKTNGSLGVLLGSPESAPADSVPLTLELGLLTGTSVAERVRLTIGMTDRKDPVHGDLFLSFAQGWYVSDHPDFTATFCSEYAAGGVVSVDLARELLFVDFALGPFLSLEQLSTVTLLWSTPLGYRDTLGLVAEAGIHVRLPLKGFPMGIGWRFRWRPLQSDIMQSDQAFEERTPIDFELFLVSWS